MIDFELFKVIGAGGDLALIAIAHAIWKLDRRVLKLELGADQ